jgi:GNAT superfamily N-acetyltransferase
MEIRPLTADDEAGLRAFFADIPLEDRGFVKEDLDDTAVLRRWLDDERGVRLVAVDDDGSVRGLGAAWPGLGRSSHVGDLRRVIAPAFRRQGLGQLLARRTLAAGLRRGLAKLTVEVVAEQQGTIDMFLEIGFEPEALLRDELRDPDGTLHDLILVSHHAEDAAAAALLASPEEIAG